MEISEFQGNNIHRLPDLPLRLFYFLYDNKEVIYKAASSFTGAQLMKGKRSERVEFHTPICLKVQSFDQAYGHTTELYITHFDLTTKNYWKRRE